jgi:hypothetical protein
MLVILNCVSLCLLSLASYLVWWDRRNILNQFFIGFCIIGYIIPSIILDFEIYAATDIIRLYYLINIIGVLFYLCGLFLGYKWKSILVMDSLLKFSIIEKAIDVNDFSERILRISIKIYFVCLIVMVLCFIIMGFVPMFASDPYLAKQFKGIYQPSYQHVALFYRTAKQFIEFLMPFIIIDFYINKKLSSLILILFGSFLIFITMSRGETVMGLLIIFSMIIALKRGKLFFFFYLVLLILFFSFGSSFWSVLAYLFPNSGFAKLNIDKTVAETIAAGAPDIPDQLQLLNAFVVNNTSYTYGLTFIGGLIPFNFKWNPAVWTLLVSNQTDDISEIASGGLRLPVSLWGYFSFGWIGVAVVSFISAFFTGYTIKKVRKIILRLKPDFNGLTLFYFLVFMYLNIAVIFIEFYKISIYSVPAFMFFGFVMYNQNKNKAKVEV